MFASGVFAHEIASAIERALKVLAAALRLQCLARLFDNTCFHAQISASKRRKFNC